MQKLKAAFVILLIISFPILEGTIFILLTSKVGALKTFILVTISTILGLAIDRFEWYIRSKRFNYAKNEKASPSESVFYFISLILFIIPGFLTDLLGLLLIFSPIRKFILEKYSNHMKEVEEAAKKSQKGKKYFKKKIRSRANECSNDAPV